MRGPRKLGMRVRQLVCYHVLAIRKQHIYRTLWFVKTVLRKLMSYTLISHTNAHAIRGRSTLNDVERFRNGPVHEFYSLRAGKLAKYYLSRDNRYVHM